MCVPSAYRLFTSNGTGTHRIDYLGECERRREVPQEPRIMHIEYPRNEMTYGKGPGGTKL